MQWCDVMYIGAIQFFSDQDPWVSVSKSDPDLIYYIDSGTYEYTNKKLQQQSLIKL